MLNPCCKTGTKVYICNPQDEKKTDSVQVTWNDNEGAINKVFTFLPLEDLIEVGLVSKNLKKVVEEFHSEVWSNESNKINNWFGASLDSKKSVLTHYKKLSDQLAPPSNKPQIRSVGQLFCKMLCRKKTKQEERNPIRVINKLAKNYGRSISKSNIDFINSVKKNNREATAFLLEHGNLDKKVVSKAMLHAAENDRWGILAIFLKSSNENLRSVIASAAEEIMANAQLNNDITTIGFLEENGVQPNENPLQFLDHILRQELHNADFFL